MIIDSLSLRGENEVRDAIIHRVSRDANGFVSSLLVRSGSPRASPSRWQEWLEQEWKLRFVPPASFSIFTLHSSIHWQSVDRHASKGLATTRVVRTEADRDWLPCPFSLFTLHSSRFNLHWADHSNFVPHPSFHACEETEVGLNDGSW
jgi:hypothetical protein